MRVRRVLFALVVVGATLFVAPRPANAATAVHVTLSTTGYYTDPPGLLPGPFVHWAAYGAGVTVTGVVNDVSYVLAPGTCSLNGYGNTEVILGGTGDVWWTCTSGPLASNGGAGKFVRHGSQLTMAWTGDLTGVLHCFFTIDNGLAPYTFVLTCTGDLTGPFSRR